MGVQLNTNFFNDLIRSTFAIIRQGYDGISGIFAKISKGITTTLNTVLTVFDITQSILDTITTLFDSITKIELVVPKASVPGSIKNVPIIGDLAKVAIAAINFGIDTLNNAFKPITAILDVLKTLLSPIKILFKAIQTTNDLIKDIIKGVIDFIGSVLANLGVVLYLPLYGLYMYAIGFQINFTLVQFAPIAGIMMALLPLLPMIICLYAKFGLPLPESDTPADPAVKYTEEVLLTPCSLEFVFTVVIFTLVNSAYSILILRGGLRLVGKFAPTGLIIILIITPVLIMADYFYTLYSIMIDPINSLMRTILTKLEKPSDQGQIDRYVGGISLLQSQNGHTYQDNPFNILLYPLFDPADPKTPNDLLNSLMSAGVVTADDRDKFKEMTLYNIIYCNYVDVMTSLTLDLVYNDVFDWSNFIILCYSVILFTANDILSFPVVALLLDQLPGAPRAVAYFLVILPLILFVCSMSFTKPTPYYKDAVMYAYKTVTFQNSDLYVIYPIVYLAILLGYYQVIFSTVVQELIPLVPFFQLTAKVTLYILPILPMIDFVYRLFTLNDVNGSFSGIIPIFNNIHDATKVTLEDFGAYQNWLAIAYFVFLECVYEFLHIDIVRTLVTIIPGPINVFLHLVVLVPLAIYLYIQFVVKLEHLKNMDLTIRILTFQEERVNVIYPPLYIVGLGTYYSIMYLSFVQTYLMSMLPTTVMFIINVYPLIPVFDFIYRLFRPIGSSFSFNVRWSTISPAVNSVITDFTQLSTLYLLIYIAAVKFWYEVLGNQLVSQLIGIIPGEISLVLQIVPLIPIPIYLYGLYYAHKSATEGILWTLRVLTFQESSVNVIYPPLYIVGLTTYYAILNLSFIQTYLIGLLPQTFIYILNVYPFIPVFDFIYRLFSPIGSPFSFNVRWSTISPAVDSVINDFSQLSTWYLLGYIAAVKFWYEVLGSEFASELISVIPGQINLFLQVVPLIPIPIYLYGLYYANQSPTKGILWTFRVLTFQEESVNVIYPPLYLVGLTTYYGILATETAQMFLSRLLPPTAVFVLNVYPIFPIIDFIYRLIIPNGISSIKVNFTNLFQFNFMGNFSPAVNSVISDGLNPANWIILGYIALLDLWRQVFNDTLTNMIFSSMPGILYPVIQEVVPYIPIVLYLYSFIILNNGHNNSVDWTIQTLMFKNSALNIFYPFAYLVLMTTYYAILRGDAFSNIMNYIPNAILIALGVLPLIPVAIYLIFLLQDPMYTLRSRIAYVLNLNYATYEALDTVPYLTDINQVIGQSGSDIRQQIGLLLNLDSTDNRLNNLQCLNSPNIDQVTFRVFLAMDGAVEMLTDFGNLCLFGYLIATLLYFDLISSSIFLTAIGVLPESFGSTINITLKCLPFIPIGTWLYFVWQNLQYGPYYDISMSNNSMLSLFNNMGVNFKFILYVGIAIITAGILISSGTLNFSSGISLFQGIILCLLVLILLGMTLFLFYSPRGQSISSTLSEIETSIQNFIQIDIIFYLAVLCLVTGLVLSGYTNTLFVNWPTFVNLGVQVCLIIILLAPIIAFITSIIQSGSLSLSIAAARYAYTFFQGNWGALFGELTRSNGVEALTVGGGTSTYSNFNIISGGSSGGSSAPDLNPTLTQIERFFFGMLYADQPQGTYYSLASTVINQINLVNKSNFIQQYSLYQLNQEFFGDPNYQLSNYPSIDPGVLQFSRIDYITLPISIGNTNPDLINLKQIILQLLGQNVAKLSDIPDQVLINYVRGYDNQGHQLVMKMGSASAIKVPITATMLDPNYTQQTENQGIQNRIFASTVLSNFQAQITQTNTGVQEAQNRMKQYIGMFSTFVNTNNMHNSLWLESYVYTKSDSTQVSFMGTGHGVSYYINSVQSSSGQFNSIYNAVLSEITCTSSSVLQDPNAIFSLISAGLSDTQFQNLAFNKRDLATQALFGNITAPNTTPFSQLLQQASSSAIDVQSQLYQVSSNIVNMFASPNTRNTLNAFTNAAYQGSSFNSSTLDQYFMVNYYHAAQLLGSIYNELYTISSQVFNKIQKTECLDLIGFRRSCQNFDWPLAQGTNIQTPFINTSALKTAIINVLNLNPVYSQSLNQLPILQGTTFNVIKPGAISLLKTSIISMLGLDNTSVIRSSAAVVLRLNATQATQLNNVPCLQGGKFDLTNPDNVTLLASQILTVLGWNTPSFIKSQIATVLNLNPAQVNQLSQVGSLSQSTVNLSDPNVISGIISNVQKLFSLTQDNQTSLTNLFAGIPVDMLGCYSTNYIKLRIASFLNLLTNLGVMSGTVNLLDPTVVSNIELDAAKTFNLNPNDQNMLQILFTGNISDALCNYSNTNVTSNIASLLNLTQAQTSTLSTAPSLSSANINLIGPNVVTNIVADVTQLLTLSQGDQLSVQNLLSGKPVTQLTYNTANLIVHIVSILQLAPSQVTSLRVLPVLSSATINLLDPNVVSNVINSVVKLVGSSQQANLTALLQGGTVGTKLSSQTFTLSVQTNKVQLTMSGQSIALSSQTVRVDLSAQVSYSLNADLNIVNIDVAKFPTYTLKTSMSKMLNLNPTQIAQLNSSTSLSNYTVNLADSSVMSGIISNMTTFFNLDIAMVNMLTNYLKGQPVSTFWYYTATLKTQISTLLNLTTDQITQLNSSTSLSNSAVNLTYSSVTSGIISNMTTLFNLDSARVNMLTNYLKGQPVTIFWYDTATLKTQITALLSLNAMQITQLNNATSLADTSINLVDPAVTSAIVTELTRLLNLNTNDINQLQQLLSGTMTDTLTWYDTTDVKSKITNMLNLNQTQTTTLNNVASLSSSTVNLFSTSILNQIKSDLTQALGLSTLDQTRLASLLTGQNVNPFGTYDTVYIKSRIASLLNLGPSQVQTLSLSVSLSAASVNMLDPNVVNKIVTELTTLLSLNSTNITSIQRLFGGQLVDIPGVYDTNYIKLRVASALGLSQAQVASLNALPLLSGSTLNLFNPIILSSLQSNIIDSLNLSTDAQNTLQNLFQGKAVNILGNFTTSSIKNRVATMLNLNTTSLNGIGSLSGTTINLLAPSIAKNIATDVIQTLNLGTIDAQNIQNLFTGNSTNSLCCYQTSDIQMRIASLLNLTPAQVTLLGTANCFSKQSIDILNTTTLNQLISEIITLFNLTSTQVATLNSIPSFNQSQLVQLNFQGIPAVSTAKAIDTIQLLQPIAVDNIASQNASTFNYWYNNFTGSTKNWLSWQNNQILNVDPVTGRPTEIGWQMGCPKTMREQAHNQIATILGSLESQIGQVDDVYSAAIDSNGVPLASKILPMICRLIDTLAVPNQFVYQMILKGTLSPQYQSLVSNINQYLSGFIDTNGCTMSLLSLLPSTYEYSHFAINIPLNLQPFQWDDTTDTLDQIALNTILNRGIQDNIESNRQYIQQRNEIAYNFLIKSILDMTWWSNFVLWYYPLPEITGKMYNSSSSLFHYSYTDINNTVHFDNTWNGNTEAVNRFKYTASTPTTLTTNDKAGTYNGSNATIDSQVSVKNNPAVWIGNGCLGYGMQYVFSAWSQYYYNMLANLITNAGYKNLTTACIGTSIKSIDDSVAKNRLWCLTHSYKHDAMVGYVFLSVAPLTYNRLDQNYSWQDQRELAFVNDPIGGSSAIEDNFVEAVLKQGPDLLKILYMENRQSNSLNTNDEYMNSMQGIIPKVYFNNNTAGPASAPSTPIFMRTCIDNLDFGNSVYYGRSSLSAATTNAVGNLAYSPASSTILNQTNWVFNGAGTDISQSILSSEGQYYWNSADWLINRSCIGSQMTTLSNENSFFAPFSLADMWMNMQNFLTKPIAFFNVNKSYQIYPIQFIPILSNHPVTPEGLQQTSTNLPAVPELVGVEWLIPGDPKPSPGTYNQKTYKNPYATIIANTGWTTRFKS